MTQALASAPESPNRPPEGEGEDGAVPTGTEEFGRLLAAHQSAAYGRAFRLLRRESDARDAVQEAFLLAVRATRGSSAQPRDMAHFRGWLLRIVSNAALRQLRNSPRLSAVPVDEMAETLPDPGRFTPEHEAERRELRLEILRALLLLSAGQRLALLLREYQGLSYAEIAAALKIRPATVETVLVRARSIFREAYPAVKVAPSQAGCREARPLLAALVDNELDRMAWRALSVHTDGCAECRPRRLALRRDIQGRLRRIQLAHTRLTAADDGGQPGRGRSLARATVA